MMFSKLVASEGREVNALRPRFVSVEEFVETLDKLNDLSKFGYLQQFCEGVLEVDPTIKKSH